MQGDIYMKLPNKKLRQRGVTAGTHDAGRQNISDINCK